MFRTLPGKPKGNPLPRLTPGEGFTLGWRHVRLLPTRVGFGFLVLLVLLMLSGINYGNNLTLAFASLLAGIGLAGLVHTWRSLPGLRLHPEGGEPAFAGGTLCFPLTLVTPNPRRGLRIRPCGGEELRIDLEAGRPRRCLLLVRAARRGRQPLGEVQLTTTHPLGLFRARARLEIRSTALVWPAPAKTPLPLPFRPGREGPDPAGAGTPETFGDFSGHRPWRAGDAPRSIDWKALARGQGLQTKVFEESGRQECWLDPELAPEEDLEGKMARLCAWLLEAERRGISTGLRLSRSLLPPGQGERHLHACLDQLAVEGMRDA